MKTLIPPAIRPGDRIAVVAPAGPVERDTLTAGISSLADRYTFKWNAACLARDGFLAGPDKARLAEIQAAFDDPKTHVVLAARGGYGTTRLLDEIDFRGIVRNPKWIVGSSDLTALLVELYHRHGLRSIHGPMAFRFAATRPEDLGALVDLLEGRAWQPPTTLAPLCPGSAVGPLVGGNLTMLAHLAGTMDERFARNSILFLEDVSEVPYRLDRCLIQLKRAGILDDLAGVVLGAFTECKPGPDGVTALEVMERNLRPLGVPVVMDYPAAHGERNYPFVHGAEIAIEADEDTATITPL